MQVILMDALGVNQPSSYLLWLFLYIDTSESSYFVLLWGMSQQEKLRKNMG